MLSPSGRIIVKVTGARGSRGLASGPLGSGSVVADNISNDANEQSAIVSKLSYGGVPLSDRLDNTSLVDRPRRNSASPAQAVEFSRYGFAGTIPPGDFLINSASAFVNAAGQLEVDALYSDGAKRVVMPALQFHEGTLQILFVRGSAMVRIVNNAFAGHAVWHNNGVLEFGYIDGTGAVTSFGGATMAGADGDLVWAELKTGPHRAGLPYQLRSWKFGDPYPNNAAISGTYTDSNRSNGGSLAFSSFSGSNAKIVAIRIDGGEYGSAECLRNTALRGRWFPRLEGGNVVMSTIRGGNSFASRVSGATAVTLSYAGPFDATPAPVLDCFVNGARYGGPVTLTAAAGASASVDYPTGLNPNKIYDIEWRARGVAEGIDKFGKGCGLQLWRVVPKNNVGNVVPLPDNRPKVIGIGDSTMEGIVARGTPTSPFNSGGDIAWLKQACETAGFQYVASAFGGTGLLVGNDSNQPPAEDGITYSGSVYPFGHAWNYMYARPIDTVAENAESVVINLGINDASKGISTSAFQNAYIKFLQETLLRHPRARRIIAMRPFNGAMATQIQNAVTAVNDARVYYLDTASWSGITTTDGLHPDVNGHNVAAGFMAPALASLLA